MKRNSAVQLSADETYLGKKLLDEFKFVLYYPASENLLFQTSKQVSISLSICTSSISSGPLLHTTKRFFT